MRVDVRVVRIMQRLGHVTVATSSCVDISTINAPIEDRTKEGDSISGGG